MLSGWKLSRGKGSEKQKTRKINKKLSSLLIYEMLFQSFKLFFPGLKISTWEIRTWHGEGGQKLPNPIKSTRQIVVRSWQKLRSTFTHTFPQKHLLKSSSLYQSVWEKHNFHLKSLLRYNTQRITRKVLRWEMEKSIRYIEKNNQRWISSQ